MSAPPRGHPESYAAIVPDASRRTSERLVQFLELRLLGRVVVERGVDGALGQRRGPGRVPGEAVGERHRLGHQVVVGNHPVGDTQFERSIGVNRVGSPEGFQSAGVSNQTRERPGCSPVGPQTDADESWMESGAVGHQADVGGQRNREARAGGSTVDGGDHRDLKLLEFGREAVSQLGRGQTGLTFRRHSLLAVGEIGAGTETASGPGDHQRSRVGVGAQFGGHLAQTRADLRRKRIQHFGAIQRGHDHSVVASLDQQVVIAHGLCLPESRRCAVPAQARDGFARGF